MTLSLPYRSICLSLSLLLSTTSCTLIQPQGTSSPDSSSSSPPESVEAAFAQYASTGTQLHEASLEVIRHYSRDYQDDVARDGVSEEVLHTGYDTTQAFSYEASQMLIASYRVGQLLRASNVEGPASNPSELRTQRQPLGVLALAAVGTILSGAVSAYAASSMFDARAEPVIERAREATPEEAAIMAEVLELPAESSREEIVDHLENDIGYWARNRAVGEIEQRFTADGNGSTVRPFGQEVNDAFVNTTKEGGRAALTAVVSQTTGALGGQGYATALETAGYLPAQAAAADLAVSVTSAATGVPLQPLDVFQAVLVSTSSGDREQASFEPGDTELTVEQAITLLDEGIAEASVDEVESAWRTLVDAIVELLGDQVVVEEDSSGRLTVEVPARTVIHVASQSEFALAHPTDDSYDMIVSALGQLSAHDGVDVNLIDSVDFPVSEEGQTPDANNIDPPDPDQDSDQDGIPDAEDNCIDEPNFYQVDSDRDGVGNACDETACPEFAVDEDGCVEGMEWSRQVVDCAQPSCPTSARHTYTLICCCDCWDDKTLKSVYDPCRPGFLLSCSERDPSE